MKIAELKAKTDIELKEELVNLRKSSFNIRFQVSNGNVENVSRLKFLRKDIARIKTILTENKNKQG